MNFKATKAIQVRSMHLRVLFLLVLVVHAY